MVTYNQIIDILSEIASNHSQIENFGNGDLWEVVQHNQNPDFQYPMLWVEDAPMSFNEKEFQYTFNVYVFDRSNRDRVQDKEHENDVKSDMLQIGLGVLAMLHNEYDETFIDVVKSHSFESFTERLDDTLTGWRFTVSLSSPFDYDACSEPFTGNGSTFGACDPVTVYDSDGTTVIATIPSGGTYTVSPSGDATAILNNTDGTTISTTAIPAGDSEIITAPDASWTLENTLGTEIDTGSIPSGDSDSIVAPDETINVVDQNDVLQQTLTFPVYENQQIDISTYCEDATAVLKNTDGTTLSTTDIPSGTSDDITAPDATFSINSTQVATIPSGDSDSIEVRKENTSDQIGSLQGQYWRVDDSVITLKDTANNTLSTTNVPATEAQDITAPDGTVNVNKSDSTLISAQTVLSNGTTNYNVADSTAVVKDTAGVTLSTTAIKATESEDITAPDADVENSDASYTDTVESGGTLVVPDSNVNVNSSLEGTVVSAKTIDIDVTDGSSPVTPNAVSVVGNTVTVEVPAGGGAPVGATLMKTGQTTSYRTGDDGDLEVGRATDFFTLASNNPFGNTNRFTDELGGTAYTNNIVIDWSTYDGSTVLGWRRTATPGINWNDAIDGALLVSIGTFTTGWRLPNINELFSLMDREQTGAGGRAISYSPFINFNSNFALWSSTTNKLITSQALATNSNNGYVSNVNKTSTSAPAALGSGQMRYIPCRTFTVTGTTLT